MKNWSCEPEKKPKKKKKSSLPLQEGIHIHLLHDLEASWDVEGQGAGILSFRSQRKVTPEVLSKIASEGKLGNRQPYSV